jgi:putative acetyltransferase
MRVRCSRWNSRYVPPVPQGMISTDDPRADDVRELLERHLAYANANTAPEDVHALDLDGLLDPSVTFFSFRVDGELLGVAALKRLDGQHAEIKSMHTAQAARGRGIGRAMVDHLIGVARERGYRRVSLETGAGAAFAPARSLYESAKFTPCGPFADYRPSPNSAYMTLSWTARAPRSDPGPAGAGEVQDDVRRMAYDEDLANRIRELIAGDPDVTEKRMFGGLAFLVGGNMSVAASGQGGLMVRVDPDDTEALVSKPYARPFEMRGRPMQGWLRVDPKGVRTKRQLEPWVKRGVAYARSLPPKR